MNRLKNQVVSGRSLYLKEPKQTPVGKDSVLKLGLAKLAVIRLPGVAGDLGTRLLHVFFSAQPSAQAPDMDCAHGAGTPAGTNQGVLGVTPRL